MAKQLKLGTKVRILFGMHSQKVGRITTGCTPIGYLVDIGGELYGYAREELVRIPPSGKKLRRVKVGDRVELVKDMGYIAQAHQVGSLGKVTRVDAAGNLHVRFDDNYNRTDLLVLANHYRIL